MFKYGRLVPRPPGGQISQKGETISSLSHAQSRGGNSGINISPVFFVAPASKLQEGIIC